MIAVMVSNFAETIGNLDGIIQGTVAEVNRACEEIGVQLQTEMRHDEKGRQKLLLAKKILHHATEVD